MLVLTAGVLGFCFDSLLISAGIFTPVQHLFPYPLSPPWMILLWMNFASVINVSLKRLHGRYLLSAGLGSVGGPAAYYGGAKIGAIALVFDTGHLLALTTAWAVAVPSLFWIAARLNKKYRTQSS